MNLNWRNCSIVLKPTVFETKTDNEFHEYSVNTVIYSVRIHQRFASSATSGGFGKKNFKVRG